MHWFEMMAIMGKRVGSMLLGPSLPGVAQCHFRSLLESKLYMDQPITPNILQTQTHGVLCTVRALQLQPAQGCQGPLVTQQSIGSGPWQSRNTIITTKQTKYRYMWKVQVATNSMVAWCSQVTQQSNGIGSLAKQRHTTSRRQSSSTPKKQNGNKLHISTKCNLCAFLKL